MLIFPKPFKVPVSFLVWTFREFLRALAFHICNHALWSVPGWGQRSLSRMMLMLKYLAKVYFGLFEARALYLVGTFP